MSSEIASVTLFVIRKKITGRLAHQQKKTPMWPHAESRNQWSTLGDYGGSGFYQNVKGPFVHRGGFKHLGGAGDDDDEPIIPRLAGSRLDVNRSHFISQLENPRHPTGNDHTTTSKLTRKNGQQIRKKTETFKGRRGTLLDRNNGREWSVIEKDTFYLTEKRDPVHEAPDEEAPDDDEPDEDPRDDRRRDNRRPPARVQPEDEDDGGEHWDEDGIRILDGQVDMADADGAQSQEDEDSPFARRLDRLAESSDPTRLVEPPAPIVPTRRLMTPEELRAAEREESKRRDAPLAASMAREQALTKDLIEQATLLLKRGGQRAEYAELQSTIASFLTSGHGSIALERINERLSAKLAPRAEARSVAATRRVFYGRGTGWGQISNTF